LNFPPLIQGIFVRRVNRFRAEVQIGGARAAAHVPNSGRLHDLFRPGARVYLRPAPDPQRKTPYDLLLVEHQGVLVSIDARLPPKLIGEALSAVLLGVFTINGIYPGPLLLVKQPVLINTLYFSIFLINIIAFLMLAFWLKPFAMIVRISPRLLAVNIMLISVVSIYAVNTRLFDAAVAVFMGVLGYVLLRLKWPIVNLVMGVVLGEMLENRLRESLSIGDGNPLIFFTRPISLALMILTLLIVVVPLYQDRRRARAPGRGV